MRRAKFLLGLLPSVLWAQNTPVDTTKTKTKEKDEVIITGFQKIEKSKITSSVDVVKMKDIEQKAVASIDQMLQGRVPGLLVTPASGTPGQIAPIRLRGTASLSGPTDPLWVIDGMPLEMGDAPKYDAGKDINELKNYSIAGFSPEDIESITVLKDASATAIYGARAANGVILVTTKSGKKGRMNVNFSASTFVNLRPNFSKLNLMNSNQKVDWELMMASRSDLDNYRRDNGAVARILLANGDWNLFRSSGFSAISEASPFPGSKDFPYITFYQTIFYSNYIIDNTLKYNASTSEINQILGEAYALRAYTYFELINLYAPAYTGSNGSAKAVPLVTSPQLEGDFPRATLDEVYAQILSDLDKALTLLNKSQFDEGYNYRFTTVAAHALKARVHQYRGEWANALAEAETVLAAKSTLVDFNAFTYLPSSYKSVESIMNLDAGVTSETSSFAMVSNEHLALFDQTNDLRFARYFDADGTNYRTKKFNSSNEFKVSFRVGEIMLIKAEALAKLGRETDSKNTLLALAAKRYNSTGLANFTTTINGLSGNAYYAELLNERARETSFEGLRWFDLRRTTQPSIIHIYNGTTYTLNSGDARYTLPFPREARLKNPNL